MLDARIRKTFPSGFCLDAMLNTGAGRVTALFGPSGAGKSTLANCIAGLSDPDEGRITLDGDVLFDNGGGINAAPNRRHIGYVFQDARLFPHLSVAGNLDYGLKRTPPAQRRVKRDQIIDLLDIGPLLTRRPLMLSGGEKSRVAFGRAVLSSPNLLIFDEPLASLDGARKAEILPFIERLRDELAIPMIYVSHAIEEILRLADEVAVMAAGRVVRAGPAVATLNEEAFLHPDGDPGSVIEAVVSQSDAGDGLTALAVNGGHIFVPRLSTPEGEQVRLRIRARDVSIAKHKPEGISMLNVLAARVTQIEETGTAQADVKLDIGVPLIARITRRSARELAIAPGAQVFALIKSVAIDRGEGP
jgi:molybdate transport system ATP-binding protein